MNLIEVPGSITLEKGVRVVKYKKITKKISIYYVPYKRYFLRITSLNFAKNLHKKSNDEKQVQITFSNENGKWVVLFKRKFGKGVTLQSYTGKHPVLQVVLNKVLPKEFIKQYEDSKRDVLTLPVGVKLNLDEWKDLNLKLSDFLITVEKEAKTLLDYALKRKYRSTKFAKGRAYDLHLISKKGVEFFIAINSCGGRKKRRTKEIIKSKILVDIAKILPSLEGQKGIPIIISKPFESKNSWSFTTSRYLEFYQTKYNFQFLNTNFKKGWEKEILNSLSKIEQNVRFQNRREGSCRVLGEKSEKNSSKLSV